MSICLFVPSFGGFVILKPGWISSEDWLDKLHRNTSDIVGIILDNVLEYYSFAFFNSFHNLSWVHHC